MNDSGFEFVKLMLKLTFPDMFEEGGDNTVSGPPPLSGEAGE